MGVLLSLLDHLAKKREERWHVVYGPEIAKPRPPTPYLVRELAIAPGAVTLFGGAGFGGKTMALQSMLLSIAAGVLVWGHYEARQGAVIHIDFEQGPNLTFTRYQRLARQMGVDLDALGESFACTCLPEQALDDSKESLEELVWLFTGRTVAIVDAFRGAFPGAQENESGVRKYLDMLQRASEATGCTVIVIAHSRKMGDDKDVRSALRGSGALFDAAQTVYMLDGAKGKPTQVHNTKERVTGKLRETFGLRIVDTLSHDPDVADPEWGLDVEHLDATEVAAAYESEEDETAINIARMSTLAERITSLLGEPKTLASLRALLSGTSSTMISGVLAQMCQDGNLVCDGKTNLAMYSLPRQPGDD